MNEINVIANILIMVCELFRKNIHKTGDKMIQTIKSLINQKGTSIGDDEMAGKPKMSVLSKFQQLELQSIFQPPFSESQLRSPLVITL